jgi:hypothetical protein
LVSCIDALAPLQTILVKALHVEKVIVVPYAADRVALLVVTLCALESCRRGLSPGQR